MGWGGVGLYRTVALVIQKEGVGNIALVEVESESRCLAISRFWVRERLRYGHYRFLFDPSTSRIFQNCPLSMP